MGGNLDQTMLLRLWHCLVITGDTRWADCDHLMWHWPFLTWLVACLPPRPRSVFIRQISQTPGGELCRFSLLCNRSRLSTMTHVKEVENEDLIHSATSLSLLALPCLACLSLSAWDQSITQSVFPLRCSGRLPHEGESNGSWDKAAIWQRNSDFMKLKDDSRGQIGTRDWTAVSKCQAH